MVSVARRWRFTHQGLRGVIALAACMALAACGSSKISVERTSSVSPEIRSAKFIVVKAKAQDGAAEFDRYADQIAGQLVAKGLTRTTDPSQARLALMLSYDGDGANRASEDRHRSVADSKADDDKIERTVSVALYDLTRPNQYNEAVFSGWARCSVDSSRHDKLLMPALFDAVLQDWPGDKREDYRVSMPEIDQGEQQHRSWFVFW